MSAEQDRLELGLFMRLSRRSLDVLDASLAATVVVLESVPPTEEELNQKGNADEMRVMMAHAKNLSKVLEQARMMVSLREMMGEPDFLEKAAYGMTKLHQSQKADEIARAVNEALSELDDEE